MIPRRLFVAGSTGAVGKSLVALADARGVPVVPHVRPKAGRQPEARAAVLELDDHEALVRALTGCTTVVQLIGTIRSRFREGDTYERSDVGTTAALARAAAAAGVDHVILLSSVGAGKPVGAYLTAKAAAERLVRESGVPYTIFRPSAFHGDRHRAPPGLSLVAALPGLGALRPIGVDELAAAILHVAVRRAPLGAVLAGRDLAALAVAAAGNGAKRPA